MLKHLTVSNFQSIDHAEVDFGDITFLVGKGNSGKSALIRALDAVFTNPRGDSYIRQGTKKATVTLDFDDHRLVWEKELGKGGVYTLDGVAYDRTGGNVPEAIADVLGVKEFEIDQTLSLRPQLHDQFDGPFLIGESGSRIARAFGKLTKLDVIVSAQMAARKAVRSASFEARSLTDHIDRLQGQMDILPDTTPFWEFCEGADFALAEVKETENRITQMRELTPKLATARKAADVSTEGLAEDIALVKQGVATLNKMADLRGARDALRRTVTRLTENHRSAELAGAEAKREYEEMCQLAGVCGGCPFA